MHNVKILNALPANWADPILSAAQAAALLAKPHHCLLAHPHGHLLACTAPGAAADVLTLYVAPQARRTGLATTLMAQLLTHARASNCTALTLEVRASNAAAIALYTRCGLAHLTTRRAYYANPAEDALIFSLAL